MTNTLYNLKNSWKFLKQRDPVYQKFADIQVITGEKPFEELIKEIKEKLAAYEKNS